MLWSIAMMREGRMVLGGMLFAALLNFKHIYMYIALLDVTVAKRHVIPARFVSIDTAGFTSASRGLIGDTVFAILPNVKPIHTFVVTILCQSVFLWKLWRAPTYRSFVCAVTLCGWASYAFGWHVHEKAILLVLFPMRQVQSASL
ncbi:glycosyl transferase [Ceratobasidium sp. 414]|nr:glycosyl transferase [Ceratobasidium sp. 414]